MKPVNKTRASTLSARQLPEVRRASVLLRQSRVAFGISRTLQKREGRQTFLQSGGSLRVAIRRF
jgi:hypothetical protein